VRAGGPDGAKADAALAAIRGGARGGLKQRHGFARVLCCGYLAPETDETCLSRTSRHLEY
jgi:hypothetical protein